jgi:glycerophosphoryl diester phosphodiesterase
MSIQRIASRGLPNLYIGMDVIKCQNNTYSAFENVLQYNHLNSHNPINILGPNIMVTKNGDWLVTHDNVPSDYCPNPINFRTATTDQIKSVTYPKNYKGIEYKQEEKVLFLDQFLDQFFLNTNFIIFLDIKDPLFPFTGYNTCEKLFIFLYSYIATRHLNIEEVFSRLIFDSTSLLLTRSIIKKLNQKNLPTNVSFDYSDLGLGCCGLNLMKCISSLNCESRYNCKYSTVADNLDTSCVRNQLRKNKTLKIASGNMGTATKEFYWGVLIKDA